MHKFQEKKTEKKNRTKTCTACLVFGAPQKARPVWSSVSQSVISTSTLAALCSALGSECHSVSQRLGSECHSVSSLPDSGLTTGERGVNEAYS